MSARRGSMGKIAGQELLIGYKLPGSEEIPAMDKPTTLPFEKTSVGTSPWRVDGIGLVPGSAKLAPQGGVYGFNGDHVKRDKCCMRVK